MATLRTSEYRGLAGTPEAFALRADRSSMDLSAIALQELEQAGAQLEKADSRIASAGALSPDGSNVDVVDLSAEIVALLSAKNQLSVQVATLKVASRMRVSAQLTFVTPCLIRPIDSQD